MEGAAVKFALDKLTVLLNMGLEMYSVSNEVRQMESDLRMIQGFLQDANSKRNKNPGVKGWVNEVREVAYRIEDAIDIFLVDIEGNRPRSFGVWSKLVRPVKKPFKVKKLVDEVKAIRQTLRNISEVKNDLGITNVGSGSSPQHDQELFFRRGRPSDDDDSEVVGLDSDKDQIIRQLLDKNISRRTVLSIVGIGGLGKTTLAQKVYKSDKLRGQFDCCIWQSISQKYDVKYLLREILYSVEPAMRNKEPAIRDDDLTSELKRSLTQKRFFIVLDDVWETDLWESLRTALPDKNNASRVLITTRKLDVANAADGGLKPYELRYLNDDESLSLLLQKAIPIREPEGQHYLTDLNEVAKKLTKKCGGLPLALVVLGSILSRDRTYNAWKRVNETLEWHDDRAKRCSEVLLLSYLDLPYHLKPCFLYFASFPEDYEISAKHVIRMWIAEGFIPSGNGTMEERAQNILEELLQRSLVQVIKKSWDLKCKTCRVHDLVRDMAIQEAREENFFTVFTKEDDEIQFSAEKVRRAMLQCSPPTNFDIHSINARSLLLFRPYEYKLNNRGFRLLKVLSIERVNFRDKKMIHKSWLEGLIHLRYLGFRSCRLSSEFLRISFSNLKNLETVDFKGTSFKLPDRICEKLHYSWQGNYYFHSLWKVPSLRHVIIMDGDICPSFPSKGDHLKNIQTLKLKMGNWRGSSIKERWQYLKTMLTRTEHLISLAITSVLLPLLSEGTRDLSCHETIRSLFLVGLWVRDLCVLNLGMLPTNPTKLTLSWSKFVEDPMPVLEGLQSLTILRLWPWSFVGTKLTCTEGAFPRLQKLELVCLPHVSHWDIEKGAMPRLSHLKMYELDKLQVLPELQNVPMLHNLGLDERLYETSGQPENRDKIQHISYVRQLKTPYN
ncbi:hypothetical protein LUZ63_003985 [Rhynchospora breviuscula]|uniref:Uncharacterized protein n=1 Tax=Rhynchospora breviuscula TaxID=2022672 RepID=A0A9Q0D1M3_9POAL|nr:hypothetical protein LUZ63_003985 [Rhynchospora breviuscula]